MKRDPLCTVCSLQHLKVTMTASYNISLLIAKSGKPHTIGEQLILPAVEEFLKTVLHKSPFDVLKRITLSNNTVLFEQYCYLM